MNLSANSTDPERAVNPKYWVVLGVCALILSAYFVSTFMGGPVAPSTLAARALSASEANERKLAAEELASIVERVAALPQLQRVAKETKDPEVLAIVLSRLLFLRDTASLPLCCAGLKHSSKEVREKVYFSLQAYYGGALPGGIEYSPDAPAEALAQAVAKLDELQSRSSSMMMSSPGSGSAATMVAAAKKEDIANPTSPANKKEETSNAAPAAAKKDETPNPAVPSPSVAPTPSAPPSVVLAPENPAINLLAWMFRVLALIVLLAEFVGAISLVIGEHPGRNAKLLPQKPPSVADELGVILAKNSTGLWLKITVLVAGAICAVSLLMAAEMSQLALEVSRTAARMEQKIDNLPPGR